MNAKKIMGAVLVALLAAALFVGAASAADVNKGTVFVYENTTESGALLENGVWTGANGAQISVTNGVVFPGANFVAGDYKYNGTTVYVTNPTAIYSIGANITGTPYIVANGGNVYAGSNLTIGVSAAANVTITDVMVNGKKVPVGTFKTNALKGEYSKAGNTYTIKAVFADTNFVEGVPSDLLLDTVSALTYKVVEAADATISANVNTVYQNEKITLTITGTPGTTYYINGTGIDVVNDQYIDTTEGLAHGTKFIMPNTGKATFKVEITDPKEATIVLEYYDKGTVKEVKNGEIEITVSAPVVTATLGAEAYFIGQDIEIAGTSTAKYTFEFNITGTNIKETQLIIATDPAAKWGKNWEATLEAPVGLDVGTYTIKVYQGKNVVATVPVALKQPFISIIDAPEVVVQGEKAEFLINAESATKVQAYVFGTNYFEVFGGKLADEDVKNEFEVVIDKTETKNMSAGQYFAVFQHPMYNGIYNIFEGTPGQILLNTAATAATQPTTGNLLFNVTDRQTANAAQALCDALDSQNIDDMYVKYSFFIVGQDESFTMSDIPTQVVKGDKLVISGVSTANAEETVTVEMISTAFAAVPKETVGSAAFIVATTKIAEDGTWEVTLDTSDLNVDEYSVSVACSNVDKPWKNTKVNVIEGEAGEQPTEQPTTVPTEQPTEQPTEAPATPGFGALAALAGLGAVAVLLLRRE